MQVPKAIVASLVVYGAASAGPANPVAVYHVNFPAVPENQAPNSMLTKVILESNGAGWLAGGSFSGENQDSVVVQLTTGMAGGGERALPFDYEVTFEIVAAKTTANNLDQANAPAVDADFDLYAGATDTAAWPFNASHPPYEYKLTIPSAEPANGEGRRIHLRTFPDPTPTAEGWESVVLRITGVEITSDPPPQDVQLVVGANDRVRWLIRDAGPHTPSSGLPPTSGLVIQFSDSSPQLAGLSFEESGEADTLQEGNETATITLAGSPEAVPGSAPTFTLTIVDDD